jgi:hypothetical protein
MTCLEKILIKKVDYFCHEKKTAVVVTNDMFSY